MITRFFVVALFIPILGFCAVGDYEVQIEGITKNENIEILKDVSQLISLKKSLPATEAALRRRAETDISNFIDVLHGMAYYNARIDLNIDFNTTPILIVFTINPGPAYPLAEYKIEPESYGIRPQDLGLILNRPAKPKEILEAEETLLTKMARKGYPLAKIKEREVIADQKSKSIHVTIQLDPGPQAYFGETSILGNDSVKNRFFGKKIHWCTGERYNPDKVICTLDALEASGLFQSITITHAEETAEGDRLPMTIQVDEGKHRSIGFGLSYSTQRGPGFTAEWEHRNVRGLGERVSINANILQEQQEVILSYVKPDFGFRGQDLIMLTEVEHEKTEGFTERFISFSAILERHINSNTLISYGGMYKQLRTTGTDDDGDFSLLKTPMQLRWTSTIDPLDPKCGATLYLKSIPSLQMLDPQFVYAINSVIGTVYYPITCDQSCILAAKVNFGTILGSSRRSIPASERFFAGSENTLRGYKYFTVSPLDHDDDHKPLGGRSMMIYSLEGRCKFSENFGVVAFYDIGNVYSCPLPEFNKKMLQSAGIGLRYYTPVGPLRLDIAFPLNRRSHHDNAFQLYFSVGQAF